jgi:hypothetical protein
VIDGPEIEALRQRGKIAIEQSDHKKNRDHPAIVAIFANAGA